MLCFLFLNCKWEYKEANEKHPILEMSGRVLTFYWNHWAFLRYAQLSCSNIIGALLSYSFILKLFNNLKLRLHDSEIKDVHLTYRPRKIFEFTGNGRGSRNYFFPIDISELGRGIHSPRPAPKEKKICIYIYQKT